MNGRKGEDRRFMNYFFDAYCVLRADVPDRKQGPLNAEMACDDCGDIWLRSQGENCPTCAKKGRYSAPVMLGQDL